MIGSAKWKLAGSAIATLAVLAASHVLPGSAQITERTTINFDAISFDLPGQGFSGEDWRPTENTPRQIQFIRQVGDRRFQSITVWPVTFPPSLRGRSREEHASAYFDLERQKPRHEGQWTGFVEGEHSVAGRRFLTMSFEIRFPFPKQDFMTDGLFILYFPEGFELRQRFYAFMWLDGHPSIALQSGFGALDAILSSVQVRP